MTIIMHAAKTWNISMTDVYELLASTDIVSEYFIQHYDVLHTLGANYLVDDTEKYLNIRGITIGNNQHQRGNRAMAEFDKESYAQYLGYKKSIVLVIEELIRTYNYSVETALHCVFSNNIANEIENEQIVLNDKHQVRQHLEDNHIS